MITRALTVCTFIVLSILLIFCYTSMPDNAEWAGGSRAPAVEGPAGAQAPVNGAVAADSQATVQTAGIAPSGAKRQFRTLPVMNIPTGFFLFMVPIMVVLLIYIVGLIVNDISREDEAIVKDLFGTMN